MDKKKAGIGLFVIGGLALFGVGMFLIGDQHQLFTRHIEFYSEFVNLAGLSKGTRVRVGGMDAGQVVGIGVPAAVTMVYLAAASLGCLAVVLAELDQGTAFILLGWILLVSVTTGVLLSFVPVYESSRRRHLMLREGARHDPESPPGGSCRPFSSSGGIASSVRR